MADFVISEDSDMLPYGCPVVFCKMQNNGQGKRIELDHLRNTTEVNLSDFDEGLFLDLCIMSGCDYLARLPNIGFKTAHGLLLEHRGQSEVLRVIRSKRKTLIPLEYAERYERARMTFRHARVYDTKSKTLVHLWPLLDEAAADGGLDYLGPYIEPGLARKIAEGEVDPVTREPWPVDRAPVDSFAHGGGGETKDEDTPDGRSGGGAYDGDPDEFEGDTNEIPELHPESTRAADVLPKHADSDEEVGSGKTLLHEPSGQQRLLFCPLRFPSIGQGATHDDTASDVIDGLMDVAVSGVDRTPLTADEKKHARQSFAELRSFLVQTSSEGTDPNEIRHHLRRLDDLQRKTDEFKRDDVKAAMLARGTPSVHELGEFIRNRTRVL
jgi:hypothetical protein